MLEGLRPMTGFAAVLAAGSAGLLLLALLGGWPEPLDWAAFTAAAAAAWRIAALVHLPPPPWQYDLLPFADTARRGGRGR